MTAPIFVDTRTSSSMRLTMPTCASSNRGVSGVQKRDRILMESSSSTRFERIPTHLSHSFPNRSGQAFMRVANSSRSRPQSQQSLSIADNF